MSKVYFGSAHVRDLSWQSSLPGKLDIILERLSIAPSLSGKRVCIKMHLGTNVGYSTVHPVFVRRLASFVKEAGGRPFVTEISEWALSAAERGYSQETIGCPVLPATGFADKYFYTHPVDYKNLKELRVAGEVEDADYLISLSHTKGHGCSAYGGAIKNLALGAMASQTRSAIHMVQHAEPYWNEEQCAHFTGGCNKCIEACPVNAMRFAKDNKLHIGFHECNFCMGCNHACPTGALRLTETPAADFQEVLALAAQEVLGTVDPGNAIFINLATHITPFCDCSGMTMPSLVPDVGIFASNDIVAIEQATLDAIDYNKLLPGSIPDIILMRELKGHLFHRIHGKNPYIQVQACERRGLGSTEYEIEEV